MKWMVDTNAWIGFLKGRNRGFAIRLARTASDQVAVCAPVVAELYHGALKYGDPVARMMKVREVLFPHPCLPFDEAAAREYSEIRHDLECRGERIGPFDLQIAAIARWHDLTLVTSNIAEFSRVPGLKLEDWTIGDNP